MLLNKSSSYIYYPPHIQLYVFVSAASMDNRERTGQRVFWKNMFFCSGFIYM